MKSCSKIVGRETHVQTSEILIKFAGLGYAAVAVIASVINLSTVILFSVLWRV